MIETIIIMTKVPRAGDVKTRLAPVLSANECAELAACFLEDAIEKVKSLDKNLIIAFSPADGCEFFKRFSLPETVFIEQKGSDLGERIGSAFEFAFRRKMDAAVMIGTDSPTVPTAFIEKAFEDLKVADAVLGKTVDGGFYLVGFRQFEKAFLAGVEWSSEKTFRQTRENIRRAGLRLREIPEWFDIDEPPDLERLRADFEQNALSRLIAPQTFEWIKKNEARIRKISAV